MLLLSMASISLINYQSEGNGMANDSDIAEFRGPGVHHNFDDSDSGYDVDMDSRLKSFGGNNQRGRIILLGDGTEVLTDSDDTEMFDHADEDKDLDSQVHKGQVTGHEPMKDVESKTDALPEKVDPAQPEYKAIANKVLSNSTESTPQENPAPAADTQAN